MGVRRVDDRAEVTRLGEGLERTGRLGAAPIERTVARSRAWHEAAGTTARRRSSRSAPPGCASRATAAELLDAVRAANRHRDGGDLRRGGGPPRLSRRRGGARGRSRPDRRVRQRRRQLAVHLRRRQPGWTSASAWTSALSRSPSATASTAPSSGTPSACAARDRRRPRTVRAGHARRGDRDGRRRHEPRRSRAPARQL